MAEKAKSVGAGHVASPCGEAAKRADRQDVEVDAYALRIACPTFPEQRENGKETLFTKIYNRVARMPSLKDDGSFVR